MTTKTCSTLLLAGLIWLLPGTPVSSGQNAQRAADRPNVLLIMTDDQGYGDLGCHGNDVIRTPNLDRLARESVELVQFYTSPNCSPTRSSLMTGRYHYRTGVTEVARGRHLMHADEVTLAEALHTAGYRTGIFGKWHLGDNYPMRPTDQGFDEALVHKGGGIGQNAGPPGNTYFDPILEHNNRSKRFAGYCNDIFTDAAMEFIQRNRDGPFFCYVASNLPHFPLQISDEYADPYRKLGLHELNARTYGMITNIDDGVGRLLEKLSQLGLDHNTIVIFHSDNGPRTRRTKNDRYPDRYNAGLRGTKTSVYENGIRVPFFIRWPGTLAAGKRVARIAAHIDILPTLLDACRVPLPEGVVLDGVSLMPLLTGGDPPLPNRTLYFQWHNGEVPFKYVHFAARSQRFKLIQPQDNPHEIQAHPNPESLKRMLATLELYDIERDPNEIDNIAARYPEIVDRMLDDYETWFSVVTRERHYAIPQRIHLGTARENPSTLSRFDWRGPRSETGQGFWEVRLERAGNYSITLHFPAVPRAAEAHFRFGPVHERQALVRGTTMCTFADVALKPGDGRLEAFLQLGRNQQGVHYVLVERLE